MGKQRYQIIPAVYLVLRKNGKVLLTRRYNTGYQDGHYSMIAGHLDGDEGLRTALAREAKEEAGIDVNSDDLQLIHVMHHRAETDPNDERVDFYFAADVYAGEPRIMEKDKCDDMSWFALTDIPENTVPRVKRALQEVAKYSVFSERGWEKD